MDTIADPHRYDADAEARQLLDLLPGVDPEHALRAITDALKSANFHGRVAGLMRKRRHA